MGKEWMRAGTSSAAPRALPRALGRTAIGLGLFGIGLGLAELLAPRRFNRLIGVGDDRRARNVTRAFGLREIGNSLAVLGRRRATFGVSNMQ